MLFRSNYSDYEIGGVENTSNEAKLVRLDPGTTSSRIKSFKAARKIIVPKRVEKPWVVQVGAFGKFDNANRLKKQLQEYGFATEVHTVNSNGKRLHAVRIVRFETKSSAEKNWTEIEKEIWIRFPGHKQPRITEFDEYMGMIRRLVPLAVFNTVVLLIK